MSPSQPSADKVKEVTAFSKERLEKIEKSRIERDYPEVHNTALCFFSYFLLSHCLLLSMLHLLVSTESSPHFFISHFTGGEVMS